METLSLVLLKSTAWLTSFAVLYLVLLRNERFFRLNRFYLLAGIVASLLFPFYTFHYAVLLPAVTTPLISVGEVSQVAVVQGETSVPYLFWFYAAGFVIVMIRLLLQTWKIILKLRKAGFTRLGDVNLVRTPDFASSFSFFSFVFVNPSIASIEMKEIIHHEREHIHQRHWFDLMLVEFVCILQWFNPFAWIYARLVRQNHEYLADERALQSTADPAVYQAALLNQLLGEPVFSLTNSFSYSLNKKRFTMMKKKIGSPFRKLKMLLVLPVAAMLFYAFAAPEYQYGSEPGTMQQVVKTVNVKGQVFKTDGTPLYGTSVILGGSTIGTISDPEGKFELKGVPEDGQLFFSFVGFETVVKKVSTEPMKIVMARANVGIDKITVVGYGTPPSQSQVVNDRSAEVITLDKGKESPLVIFDGKEISLNDMNKISPDQIECINVLKNENATNLYGDKGKNGVVLITSKESAAKGKKMTSDIITGAANNPNPPAYYLDGVLISPKEVRQIDPDQIFAISVLKDQSATAVYGEKGKNGVVLITSKEKAGKDKIAKTDASGKTGKEVVVAGYGKNESSQPATSSSVVHRLGDEANPPLYYLDGVEITQKQVNEVKPDQIESVDVLKEKSAIALYGERAKNGVILINTKEKAAKDAKAKSEFNAQKQEQAKSPQKGEKEVFVVVEEMPEFPGGSNALRGFIAKGIRYPAEAQANKVQGKVFVTFVVSASGKVEDAKVVKSVNPLLDAEALRIVNMMPDWKPARQRGQAVSVAYTVPIEFILQ